MIQFLHGTVTFRPVERRCSNYELEVRFSEGVAPTLTLDALEALQRRYQGTLDIERLPEGGMRITHQVIAHGPESAYRHAKSLGDALLLHAGCRTNVASGLAR